MVNLYGLIVPYLGVAVAILARLQSIIITHGAEQRWTERMTMTELNRVRSVAVGQNLSRQSVYQTDVLCIMYFIMI